jgi:hypothetical protein
MNSIKKTCINSSKHFYTGTELSPLRFGLSAEGYELNSVIEGYDKELWVVDIKNGKKVWVKNDTIIRITREDPVINTEPMLLEKMRGESNHKINEHIVTIMNMNINVNKAVSVTNTKIADNNEDTCIVNNGVVQNKNTDTLNIMKNKKSTDYNLFVKYRLNQLKDTNKNKKDNFNNVKNEWHELKKDKSNFDIVMSNAKAWFAELNNN